MDTGLTGKVALVCAASRGLGKAAARGLAAEGAKVAVCARHMPTLEAAAAEIQADTGADVLAISADVARRSDITRLVDQTVRHFGRLDILVTNSGGPKPGLFGATTESDWRDAIDLVLMSTVLLCMEAVPHMRRAGGGRIINITSISAKQPIAGLMLSNALRPAVTGFSKTLANELARDGILVNCVAPGYTRTERVVELAEATAAREGVATETVEKRTVQNIPLGRMAEPSDLADLIVFLASDRGRYITGTTIPVDGGYLRGLL
jgi:3-oxoacyl-[acyl-carrier protein] reductase